MNRTKTQTALILIGTFLIGGLLGGLIVGTMSHDRDTVRERIVRRGGLMEHMRHTIEPQSEQQWEKIRPIIDSTGLRNREILRSAHQALRANIDSMISTLSDELEPEQIERLRREFRRLDRPHPPGPPPRRRR